MLPTFLQRIRLKHKDYGLVEYSLILVIMAATIMVSLLYLGSTANNLYLKAFCAVQQDNPYISHTSQVENSSLIVTVNIGDENANATLYQQKGPFNLYSSGLVEDGVELACSDGVCTGSIPFFKSRFYYIDVYNPATFTSCTIKANS